MLCQLAPQDNGTEVALIFSVRVLAASLYGKRTARNRRVALRVSQLQILGKPSL